MPNKLWLIVGPSGTGKTTLVKNVVAQGYGIEAISYTTRLPRASETDGKDYYFISKKKFTKMLKNNEFIEHVVYNNNFYGVSKKEINEKLLKNNVFLITEGNGAKQLKEIYKDLAVVVFLVPPSIAELKQRLFQRNESEETVNQRIHLLEEEMSYRYLAEIEVWPDLKEYMAQQVILATLGIGEPKVFDVKTLKDQLKVSTAKYFSNYLIVRKWLGGHWEQWTLFNNKLVWVPVVTCSNNIKLQPGFFFQNLVTCECHNENTKTSLSLH